VVKYLDKSSVWMICVLAVVTVVALFVTVLTDPEKSLPPTPCSAYANQDLDSVPARCINYFMEQH
jgi:hypothetical protein